MSQSIWNQSRRSFLATGSAAIASTLLSNPSANAQDPKKPPVVLFSKHLGGTGYTELADHLVELGYDGTDLTVRPGGHVLPERVEEDLPKAVEAVRKVGLEVYMITTNISSMQDKQTEPILKTASKLGIPFYRIGDFGYDRNRPWFPQLQEWNAKFKDLAAMNADYNITAGYHNHSGKYRIGGSIWDLHHMLDGVDPQWFGSNYDMGHAMLEGSGGAWETNFHLIKDRIKMSAVKDCVWRKTEDRGWRSGWAPIGEGMVDWRRVLELMKEAGFSGPFSIHFEYDIPGASKEEEHKNHLAALKQDLQTLREKMKEVGW